MIRNFLYDHETIKAVEFSIPVISVGNLSVGGTGKSPHTEYLIRLLKDFHPAILSRGYKRKTKGYVFAQQFPTSEQIGDEPAQYKLKYPELAVAVAESRALAIPQLLFDAPNTRVVLLDDAMQHRAVKPGLSIMLTEYDNLFTRDFILPVGRLRENRSAYKRVEMIIVTKCPEDISPEKKQLIVNEIAPQKGQQIFFSKLVYYNPYYLFNGNQRIELDKNTDVLGVSGIARPESFLQYLEKKSKRVFLRKYADHHIFDRADMEAITESFQNLESPQKIIVTTEKDAVRLVKFREWMVEYKLPVFVLPTDVQFIGEDGARFDRAIFDFIGKMDY